MSDTQSLALEINSSCSFFYDLLLPTFNRDEPTVLLEKTRKKLPVKINYSEGFPKLGYTFLS
ncbi:MAG: hypothetical protein B7Y39_19395 [Bdellovibrio sp. 28-41-41]|nr:MAG: hypothetical protein B7Y39_19395 [Bdellovibrio sp. 28-41-41]